MTVFKQNELGRRDRAMVLIALWHRDQDFSIEEPLALRWHDGSVATMEDFHEHRFDTHTFVTPSAQNVEQHMFPSIVAQVLYEESVGVWQLRGRGVIPRTLSLTDPSAGDDDIFAELSTFSIVYRASIIRSFIGPSSSLGIQDRNSAEKTRENRDSPLS